MKNRELARRLRGAFVALQKARGAHRVAVRHVWAHARDAGNETADGLAKAAAADASFGQLRAPLLMSAREMFSGFRVAQPLGQELGVG